MKCYEAHSGVITPGLPIEAEGDSRFVRLCIRNGAGLDLGGERIPLADSLAETLRECSRDGWFQEPSRLLQCDVEKRAQVWIDRPSDAFPNHALVLVSGWEWLDPERLDRDTVSVAFVCPDSNCEILARYSVERQKVGTHVGTGCALLVKMAPGSRLLLQVNRTTQRAAFARLMHGAKRSTEMESTISLDAAGNLSWPTQE